MKAIVRQGQLVLEESNLGEIVAVESNAWFAWLEEHHRFIFEGTNGRFSARQETIYGSRYWYGYRRLHKKLHKLYLGKSVDLTLDRLVAACASLENLGKNASPSSPELETSVRTAIADAVHLNSSVTAELPFTLMTRLIPPTLPANLVDRQRLIREINTPITLISAPSGFGKTTLLKQWLDYFTARGSTQSKLHAERPQAVWITLESEEDSPYTFWTSIVLGLQRIDPMIGDTISILLHSLSSSPIQQILTGLIKNLTQWQGSRTSCDLAILIDDYQWVRSPAIHASCQFFLDHLPPRVRVVIASQTHFPFSIDRWRARGILTELTRDVLRLTAEEGVTWLNTAISVPLTAREKLSLAVQAGGWSAGLNLLALVLNRQEEIHRFIATFSEKPSVVQGYFVEEIFRKQPADIQRFLLQTSILKNLNGALCDAVTGGSGSEQILAQLYESNQFVTLLEQGQVWYQYHDLFAQGLQDLLKQHFPGEIPGLHKRAAQWYQHNGLYSEVIHHVVQAGDWPAVSDIIEHVILDELHRGSDDRVLKWIQQLPIDLFLQSETLPLMYARLALPSLPYGQVGAMLKRIMIRIESLTAEARTASQQALLFRLNEWERSILTGLPIQPLNPGARDIDQVGYLLDLLCQRLALIRQGKLAAAENVLYEAYEQGKARGIVFVVLTAASEYANLIAMNGRLHEAEAMIRDTLQWTLDQTGRLPSVASVPLTYLGKLYYVWNQTAQARQFIQDAVLIDPNPTSLNMIFIYNGLMAHVLNAQGDRTTAQVTFQSSLELAAYTSLSLRVQDLKANQALIYIRQRQLEPAQTLLRQISSYPLPPDLVHDELLRTAWAELFLAMQQYEEAEMILTQPGDSNIHTLLLNVIPQTNILLALAYWGQRKTDQAWQQIIEALQIAHPEGIVRPFLDCGDQIVPLLVALLHTRLDRSERWFTLYLLEQCRLAFPAANIPPEAELTVATATQLSKREQQILRLLEDGLDNKALAISLVLSESTVRTHIRNLYRKLSVNSRIQAIKRARELRML